MNNRFAIFRWLLPAGLVIACLGFGLFFVPASDGTAPRDESGKERRMIHPIGNAAIPPIDTAAPAKIETASFALG
jgi:hypothetical protein